MLQKIRLSRLITSCCIVLFFPWNTFADEQLVEGETREVTPETQAFQQEKLPDDPTKIVTKIGFGYSEDFVLRGSVGLDEIRMINVRVEENADQWSVGGSWLFKFGIVNVNLNKNQYDDEVTQYRYSIGTFIPLSVLGFTPYGMQIFPMAGYSYNDSEVPAEHQNSEFNNDIILVSTSSHGGYLGAFALKPLTDNWTLISFGGGALGSNDYSGYWLGAGVGCKIDDRNSLNIIASTSDNSYGDSQNIGVSYTHEFN